MRKQCQTVKAQVTLIDWLGNSFIQLVTRECYIYLTVTSTVVELYLYDLALDVLYLSNLALSWLYLPNVNAWHFISGFCLI